MAKKSSLFILCAREFLNLRQVSKSKDRSYHARIRKATILIVYFTSLLSILKAITALQSRIVKKITVDTMHHSL